MSWRYFTFDEFRCNCGCGKNRMERDFIDKLDDLRKAFGLPLVPSSGYRCPEYNSKISTTGVNGPHTKGRAVDLLISRGPAYRLTRLAFQFGFTGIGFSQKGDVRFIHLDDLPNAVGQPRPTVWSY